MPDQRSLTDQLQDLRVVARERGMYDADDYLRRIVENASEDRKPDGKADGLRTFQVWSEGYRATGDIGYAMFHGEYWAKTFKNAVQQAVEKHPHMKKDVNFDRMTYWGCRFFDNEADARKSFG